MFIYSNWLFNRSDQIETDPDEAGTVGTVLLSKMPDIIGVEDYWGGRFRGVGSLLADPAWEVASRFHDGTVISSSAAWGSAPYHTVTDGTTTSIVLNEDIYFRGYPHVYDPDHDPYTTFPVEGIGFFLHQLVDGVPYPMLGVIRLDEAVLYSGLRHPVDHPPRISGSLLFTWES